MQLIQLALLTKWMAVLAGIVDEPPWMKRITPHLNLELGLLLSVGLLVAGLIWSFRLVYSWGSEGFGALEPTHVMRQAIPSVTLMIVGAQAAAGTLFAGALQSCWQSSSGRSRNG